MFWKFGRGSNSPNGCTPGLEDFRTLSGFMAVNFCTLSGFMAVFHGSPVTFHGSLGFHDSQNTLSGFMAVLRIFSDVSVWPRCLIASRWKLCSEDEILFIFSENVSLVLYPESFYFLKIFYWSWMRHIYGYTLSVFKTFLRIFADVSVWPQCLIASGWKLCSEGEILFVFSENVSFVLYPQSFYFLKIFPWTSYRATYLRVYLVVFQGNLDDVWSHVQGDSKRCVPIFCSIKNPFFNECLFCCRTWLVNLWMIVCSYSCPKNVLDKSAEDSLPGDLFCNKIIPECTDSVSKTFPLSQLSTKINDC